MELIILITNILITALAYLIVPMIFFFVSHFKSRQYSLSTIKKIVIINGVCVWLLFQIITDGESTSAAVFLWSGVAYWLMKKLCGKNEKKNKEIKDNNKNSDNAKDDEQNVVNFKYLFKD